MLYSVSEKFLLTKNKVEIILFLCTRTAPTPTGDACTSIIRVASLSNFDKTTLSVILLLRVTKAFLALFDQSN